MTSTYEAVHQGRLHEAEGKDKQNPEKWKQEDSEEAAAALGRDRGAPAARPAEEGAARHKGGRGGKLGPPKMTIVATDVGKAPQENTAPQTRLLEHTENLNTSAALIFGMESTVSHFPPASKRKGTRNRQVF